MLAILTERDGMGIAGLGLPGTTHGRAKVSGAAARHVPNLARQPFASRAVVAMCDRFDGSACEVGIAQPIEPRGERTTGREIEISADPLVRKRLLFHPQNLPRSYRAMKREGRAEVSGLLRPIMPLSIFQRHAPAWLRDVLQVDGVSVEGVRSLQRSILANVRSQNADRVLLLSAVRFRGSPPTLRVVSVDEVTSGHFVRIVDRGSHPQKLPHFRRATKRADGRLNSPGIDHC